MLDDEFVRFPIDSGVRVVPVTHRPSSDPDAGFGKDSSWVSHRPAVHITHVRIRRVSVFVLRVDGSFETVDGWREVFLAPRNQAWVYAGMEAITASITVDLGLCTDDTTSLPVVDPNDEAAFIDLDYASPESLPECWWLYGGTRGMFLERGIPRELLVGSVIARPRAAGGLLTIRVRAIGSHGDMEIEETKIPYRVLPPPPRPQ